MKTLLAALFCGFLFGFGLIISGMTNPARVLNFLDWSARWDPTLAFVMGGAIAVALPGFHWLRKREKPLYSSHFELPAKRKIDAKLVFGAGLFGIGWGIAGLCPGPAVVAAATLDSDLLLFFAAMVSGMVAQHWFFNQKLNKNAR
ncbi:YeeE/YedE family protein [Alteromonas ponticola]|uniref:YeeE/YedE family protein n=1 Tax=Alteromonas ponticola TaxID=2720613 RepID=A0ABX1R481_9ALTE|nr:YeeE/YedE family protein [Alteromonas ponticola]NMH60058.1 YeeE/YedE family protein [Alteromonas ponticola]